MPWEPICRLCGKEKAIDEFPVRRDSGKRRTECHTCLHARTRAWALANQERRRTSSLKYDSKNREQSAVAYLMRTYGLTREQAQAIRRQGGRCPICLNDDRSLHVDHDHSTGAVRGRLCGPCNRGLGFLGDNEDALARALNYLRSPPGLAASH